MEVRATVALSTTGCSQGRLPLRGLSTQPGLFLFSQVPLFLFHSFRLAWSSLLTSVEDYNTLFPTWSSEKNREISHTHVHSLTGKQELCYYQYMEADPPPPQLWILKREGRRKINSLAVWEQ